MKIYTKTGDSGTTGLIGGARIAKNSSRMKAIGDIDELNAAIGVARLGSGDQDSDLAKIQNLLFDLGAEIASPNEHRRQYRAISVRQIEDLEASIDRQVAEIPPLEHFILPGGCQVAARLHLARCICRRAERSVLELDAEDAVGTEAKAFLNRLSDWLFVAARTANRLAGVNDVKWERIGE